MTSTQRALVAMFRISTHLIGAALVIVAIGETAQIAAYAWEERKRHE